MQNVGGDSSAAFAAPPVGYGMRGEGRGVVGHADDDRAPMAERVIHAVGDRDAPRIGTEVMVVDRPGLTIPARARVLEEADEFALLGIDADDGPVAALKTVA